VEVFGHFLIEADSQLKWKILTGITYIKRTKNMSRVDILAEEFMHCFPDTLDNPAEKSV
jgi:hypothetical protein